MKSEKSDIFIENILILSYSMTLGGEPIKVDEYYETGQVTEFRYCIKVGEGVKNGFFNLPNFYDPVSITYALSFYRSKMILDRINCFVTCS